MVERRVEHRDLRHARQDLLDGVYALQARRIVQRRYLAQRTYLLFRVFVDQAALREEFAAVRHAVAYGFQLVERADDPVPGVGQGRHDQLDARRVVRNRPVQLEFLFAHGFVGQVALRKSDAFYEAFCEQFARCRFHVDYLVFDRRGTAVEYQYYHVVISSC